MAATVQLIGTAYADNVTSLSISTPNLAAGGRIFVCVAINQPGFDNVVDTVGNNYNQVGGSEKGVGCYLMEVDNNLQLHNNNQITLENNVTLTPFSAAMSAVYISGLTSGQLVTTSAAQGTGTQPIVAVNSTSGYWLVGMIAVDGPSSDGFTQDPAWSTPSTINSLVTTTVSCYAGYRQAPGGNVLYAPTLGVARPWAGLMAMLTP
jgi:hypothetical protein